MIPERIAEVRETIRQSAHRSGRLPDQVRLMVVTKEVSIDKMRLAIDEGATLLGENRVQSARDKVKELGREGLQWHMIGNLQKNKVKYIFDLFDRVDSVDSLALAEAIDRRAHDLGTVMPILLQINISGEQSKHGMEPEALGNVLDEAEQLKGIKVEGLMTIPPKNSDPESARPYFSKLRELRDKYAKMYENMPLSELSMGMSSDYAVAIEEGATIVRVGTSIFGSRS